MAHKTKILPTPDILDNELISFTIKLIMFVIILIDVYRLHCLALTGGLYGKSNSSVVKEYEKP